MAEHQIEGKNFYLRVIEPVKFVKNLIKNIEKAKARGFKVKIMLGGPEFFPAQTYDENNISFNKISLFIYGITYWTHIAFDIKGGTDEENAKEVNNILSGIEDEVVSF